MCSCAYRLKWLILKYSIDFIDLETLLECPVGATDIMLEDSSPNFLG